MDLIDRIDHLLSTGSTSSDQIEKLLSLGRNTTAFRDILLSREAIYALKKGDFQAALSRAWMSVLRNPTQPEFRMLLGKVFLDCGEIDLALENFEQAVALKPDSLDYQFIYIQTLFRSRPTLARATNQNIAKYVTRETLPRFIQFAKSLNVVLEGGAWRHDDKITIWLQKDGRRTYAKFRVTWLIDDAWHEDILELEDTSDDTFCTLEIPWLYGAELCTIHKTRNGERLHGCPLFGRQRDKSIPAVTSADAAATPTKTHVIIPVYKGLKETRACLRSVFESHSNTEFRTTIILDAPKDRKLIEYVRSLSDKPDVTILENAENIGFTASVNRALRRTKNEDVVLLNADTVVPDGWLDRLYNAAYSKPDIGTVTPLSNNGEIVSFPLSQDRNQIPPGLTLVEIDQITADVNAGQYVDLPTGVGFCMFIKSETLHAVGLLDSFNFGRGYGEETDFCLRARAIGWKNVCATDVFVEHVSKVSFGGEKEALARLNMKRVGKKHPEYSALMGGFLREDPLSDAFRRLERAILSRRTQASWTLIVAPKDWRTNIALEPMRHAAAVSDERILWLYPDDKQRDRLWLTSDTSFSFGRLSYELDSEEEDLGKDLGHLDITHIHWFEPPANGAVLKALCQTKAEQTLYLVSSTMAEFLKRVEPLSQQLITACPNAKAYSVYGLNLLETLGVLNSEQVQGHAGLHVQEGKVSSSKRDTAEPISIAVVGGFQSRDGVEKLLEVARYAAADNLPVTFYLFANTLHDLELSRTKKVVPLGFVSPEEISIMIKRLGCKAAISVDMDPDPAPMALERAANEVGQVFCFEGGARTDLPQTVGNIAVLHPDTPSPQLLGSIMNALKPIKERIVCDA